MRAALAIVLLILLGYGGIEAWPLIAGPHLSLTAPQENATSTDGIIAVSGTALRAALLTVNGEPTLHDEQGNFSTTLALPRGGSILTIRATDRFGRSVSAVRDVFIP